MFDANNKAVDYLFRALCQPEFDRVHTKHLACRIWSVLKEANVGNAQVKDRNGEPERGGSEWEAIKILFKNSAYEPDFTRAPPQASIAKFT
jgi:hypothetical protein